MAYENTDNRYYKYGAVRIDQKMALDQTVIVARFDVGPGGAQISLEELREAALKGRSLQKRHFDGQVFTGRIDAEILVGDGPNMFTKAELKEIYEIEKAKEKERLAQVKAPADAADLDDLKAVVAKQAKQIEQMIAEKEAKDAAAQ